MMVLLPIVIVELVAPNVNVVPPSTTSVTDEPGRGPEGRPEDLGPSVDVRAVPG
jgi:hypothetical protein